MRARARTGSPRACSTRSSSSSTRPRGHLRPLRDGYLAPGLGCEPLGHFAGITARSLEGIASTAFAALGAVMVGMALVERFFCQFLCPFGAIFSLLPVLPISLFNRRRESCARGCNRCQDSCPVRIHPERADLRSGECIACGRCADGCPMANVTLARLERL
ncbi:MAG: 4Fe-4S binding protein [Collinsella sp.]